MNLSPITFAIVLLTSLVVSAVSVPLCRGMAPRLGQVAHPVDDRWNRRTVPKLGGVAILFGLLAGLATGGWAHGAGLVTLMGTLMFVVGLADDLRPVRPATKLVLQTAVAALFVYFAPAVSITSVPVIDTVLALLWVVGLTNAFNLLDNMDGLAAGTSAIAAAALLVLVYLSGDSTAVFVVSTALLGAALGFLFFNFQPASIFMGDAGSHLLGGTIAGATLLATGQLKAGAITAGAVPIAVLLIPIADTTFVTLTRGLDGRSAFLGGRDHLSHRLVALGISERRAVLLLYALAAAGGAVAIALTQLHAPWPLSLGILYVVGLGALGVYLGHIEVRRPDGELPLVSEVAYRRRAYEAALDLVLIALAYYLAFSLRFGGEDFRHFLPYFVKSLPVVIVCQLAGFWSVGKYRQVWYALNSAEILTILRGIVTGATLSILAILYLYRFEGFSRAVFAVDMMIVAFLTVGARVVISAADEFLRHSKSRGRATLIFGAGRGGRLLARELLQNHDLDLSPIGFIDDDPAKRRMKIEGLRVVGTVADLSQIARRCGVTELVVGIRDLSPQRFDEVVALCQDLGITVRRMRFSLEDVRVLDDRSVLRFGTDRTRTTPRS